MLDDLEQHYYDVRHRLYIDFPNAAFGPAHVVLDDENWDAYGEAIGLIYATLAHRSLVALGLDDFAIEMESFGELDPYRRILRNADYYADHSIEELGATLFTLRLIEWYANGCVGDGPIV